MAVTRCEVEADASAVSEGVGRTVLESVTACVVEAVKVLEAVRFKLAEGEVSRVCVTVAYNVKESVGRRVRETVAASVPPDGVRDSELVSVVV